MSFKFGVGRIKAPAPGTQPCPTELQRAQPLNTFLAKQRSLFALCEEARACLCIMGSVEKSLVRYWSVDMDLVMMMRN